MTFSKRSCSRHEHQFGASERAALYCYLRDPAHWGISWEALVSQPELDGQNLRLTTLRIIREEGMCRYTQS